MSTGQVSQRPAIRDNADTRVSGYDQMSALLVAGVTVIGALVFILFMIWLTLFAGRVPLKPPATILELAGNDNRPEGIADDWQPPGVEEFPEVEEPQLADALEAVTDSVSVVRAQLEKVDGNAAQMGTGSGLGDKRAKGPGSGNSDIIPEWDRWQIEYTAGTMAEYMNILQSFGISLGAVAQLSNQIHFISELNNTRPAVAVGTRESPEAQMLWFRNQKTRLRKWDENKVSAGGVELKNRLVVQFYPGNVRQLLLNLEQAEYAPLGKDLRHVQRTVFRCRPAGNGYEYYVHKIDYRAIKE